MGGVKRGAGMRKEKVVFDSRDGKSRIYGVRWIPEGEVKGILQIIHGMSEYIDRYEPFAEYLVSQGYLVCGEDHLGHGQTAILGEMPTGYFCPQDPATVVVRDVHRLKKLTEELYPGVPYFILGHSMGSFIARNYLLRYGKGIRGAIIMGTGQQSKGLLRMSKAMAGVIGFFCGQKHLSKVINQAAFGAYCKRIANPETPQDWLSVNRENVTKYNADPMCGFPFTINGFKCLFELLDRLTDEKELLKIPATLPVFFVAGQEDPVGDYGEAVKKVKESFIRAGIKDVSLKLYEGDRHEILNEDDRQQVYEDLLDWLNAHLEKPQA